MRTWGPLPKNAWTGYVIWETPDTPSRNARIQSSVCRIWRVQTQCVGGPPQEGWLVYCGAVGAATAAYNSERKGLHAKSTEEK